MRNLLLHLADWFGDQTIHQFFRHPRLSYAALRCQGVIQKHYRVWPYNHTNMYGDF